MNVEMANLRLQKHLPEASDLMFGQALNWDVISLCHVQIKTVWNTIWKNKEFAYVTYIELKQ